MGRRPNLCARVAACCVAATCGLAAPLRAQTETRSAAAASRPFATVGWESRPVARSAAYPPWNWPTRAAFERRADVRTLLLFRLRIGRADVRVQGEDAPRTKMRVLLEEEPQPDGVVVRCTAGRAEPGYDAALEELLYTFRAPASSVADAAWSDFVLTDEGLLRLDFDGAREAPRAASRPTRAAAELFGYAAALLDDSPGDPPVPVAACGNDRSPEAFAALEAHVALAAGATGKYLRRRLAVANLGFVRWNFAEYWPLAHDAQGSSLIAAPIDVARFLAGLTLQFDCDPPRACEVSTGTIAAVAEGAGVAEEFERWLKSSAEDDALDDRNRLRATQVLYALRARRCEGPRADAPWFGPRRPIPAAVDAMRDVRLSAAAKLWLGLPD